MPGATPSGHSWKGALTISETECGLVPEHEAARGCGLRGPHLSSPLQEPPRFSQWTRGRRPAALAGGGARHHETHPEASSYLWDKRLCLHCQHTPVKLLRIYFRGYQQIKRDVEMEENQTSQHDAEGENTGGALPPSFKA